MIRLAGILTLALLLSPLATSLPADAGGRDKVHSKHMKSAKKYKKSRSSKKVGGYSLTRKDILTPAPLPDRGVGPFDSGMWFNSGSHRPISDAPSWN